MIVWSIMEKGNTHSGSKVGEDEEENVGKRSSEVGSINS